MVTVRALAELGVQVSTVFSGETTALMVAAENGHESTVRALVELGAQVDAVNSDGSTALMKAAGNGHESITRRVRAPLARLRLAPRRHGHDDGLQR